MTSSDDALSNTANAPPAHARETHRQTVSAERDERRRATSLRAELEASEARIEQYKQLRIALETLHPQLGGDDSRSGSASSSGDEHGESAGSRPDGQPVGRPDAGPQVFDVPALVLDVLKTQQGRWIRPGDLAEDLAYAMTETSSPTAKIRRILRDLTQNGRVEVKAIDGRSKAYRFAPEPSAAL